jgi:hypothetical protein
MKILELFWKLLYKAYGIYSLLFDKVFDWLLAEIYPHDSILAHKKQLI